MTVFSGKKRVLEKVNLKQVQGLLSILSEATLRRTPFIESRYKERAPNFTETVQFLADIGWICRDQDELSLSERSMQFARELITPAEIADELLEAMTTTDSEYGDLLSRYLARFSIVGNEAESRPTTISRLQESAIRNFLMDLGVVSYDDQQDRFVLNQNYNHLYVWAKNLTGSRTKASLETTTRHREEFGRSAEDAVFEYEKIRVGEQLANKVQHISKTLPFASYDIKSFTVDAGSTVDRFIEVKAVSRQSYEFFWTRIELEAARLLRDKYYLYLLPSHGQTFDFSELLILKNAYETVYENKDAWAIEENVVVCQKK
jgi:uncharacterized protein DUF3883